MENRRTSLNVPEDEAESRVKKIAVGKKALPEDDGSSAVYIRDGVFYSVVAVFAECDDFSQNFEESMEGAVRVVDAIQVQIRDRENRVFIPCKRDQGK